MKVNRNDYSENGVSVYVWFSRGFYWCVYFGEHWNYQYKDPVKGWHGKY